MAHARGTVRQRGIPRDEKPPPLVSTFMGAVEKLSLRLPQLAFLQRRQCRRTRIGVFTIFQSCELQLAVEALLSGVARNLRAPAILARNFSCLDAWRPPKPKTAPTTAENIRYVIISILSLAFVCLICVGTNLPRTKHVLHFSGILKYFNVQLEFDIMCGLSIRFCRWM